MLERVFLSPIVVTGWETENKYRIRNTLGQDVYFARESMCTSKVVIVFLVCSFNLSPTSPPSPTLAPPPSPPLSSLSLASMRSGPFSQIRSHIFNAQLTSFSLSGLIMCTQRRTLYIHNCLCMWNSVMKGISRACRYSGGYLECSTLMVGLHHSNFILSS